MEAMATASLQTEPAESSSGEPLLWARDVYCRYGDVQVLNGVNFAVWPGQLVAITGENGAGKSTLVRCIAGDLSSDGGEVLIDGVRVRSNAAAASRGVAVVWQDLALCDNLDVAANLFLGREHGRVMLSDPATSADAHEILSSFGVNVGDARSVGALSAGQRQSIAVARAMQSRPRLLVLDEPTASLGVQETRKAEELIAKLRAQGTTILLVSHDVEQVFRLADRILVLYRGRVAADLAPSEAHPDDIVAIMAGHPPDATARQQLSRLQDLVDQLASAKPNSSLPLIVSALGAALRTEQLCVHLVEETSLRCVAAIGLPNEILDAWGTIPVGPGGGPIGAAAASGRIEIDEDVEKSPSWRRFATLSGAAGIRSSWSVPLIGSSGLIGVITGCHPVVGRPRKDQMDLVSLYAGYAAGAIERDRLFGEVTARNRVLETIREILETLAGPEPVSRGLMLALRSLHRGLRAAEIELWLKPSAQPARCVALVDADSRVHADPPGRDEADASLAFATALPFGPIRLGDGTGQVVVTALDAPGGQAALVARWATGDLPDDAEALLGDAANSVHLALEREEAELAQHQTAALLRSHQLQRDFLSRLSHELRTPLTAIRGYASSLLASDVTWDDESKLRFLNTIAGESARLGRLVGDLLDFSAIESDLLRLHQDWCDLDLIIEAAVACLPAERARAVAVHCPTEVGSIWADHDRLEQVFVNLFENAFRHNPPGVAVEVDVSFTGHGAVAVRVADNGKGIDEKLKSHLFEAGPQSDGDRSRAGLGLSIARAIVTAHGGEISLDDAPNGTCFRVVLPVEDQEESAE